MKLHFEPNLLLSTSNKRGTFTAQVELDFQRGAHVRRETATVQPGEDLEQKTQRAVYADCLVQNIGCKAGGMSPESQPGRVPRNGQMPRQAIATPDDTRHVQAGLRPSWGDGRNDCGGWADSTSSWTKPSAGCPSA